MVNKVLVVEDDSSLSRIIKYDLSNAGFDVDVALNGLDAVNLIKNNSYDIIVLDWMLPGLNGIEIIQKIRKNHDDVYIIMLSARNEEMDIINALESGADDFMVKPFSFRELIARIKSCLRRKNYESNKLLKTNDLVMDLDKHEVYYKNEILFLTKKEYDLLEYFINNRQILLTREQLLSTIWGYQFDGDNRIVDVHVFKLREKLQDKGQLIKTVRGIGYLFEG